MCESFRETDPEFSAFFEDFACQQAPRHCGLTEPVRFLVLLSALAACGGPELYASTLNDALDAGLTPVQAREILYHTVPYAGYARAVSYTHLSPPRRRSVPSRKGLSKPAAATRPG